MKTTNHRVSQKRKKNRQKVKHLFPVVIERDEEGFFAACPTLQGCFTDGETLEEAVKNIQEVIELHVEDRLACGEEVPGRDVVSIMTMEVEV